MKDILAYLLITPLFFFLAIFVFKAHARTLALSFCLLFVALSIALYVELLSVGVMHYHFGGFSPPLGIAFQATLLNSSLLVMSSVIFTFVSLFAGVYLPKQKQELFYPLSVLMLLGFVVLFFSRDIFNLYVALEIIGMSAVALAALANDKKGIRSSLQYLFATLIGSGFYLFAVALLYARYATLHIDTLAQKLVHDNVTLVAALFIALGLLLKSALFPLHYWLPAAHSNSLSPVSALLSALVVKSSFYLLFVLAYELFDGAIFFYKALGYLGILAIFYGGIQAFFAKDIKLMVAYSTVSQLGYLFMVFAFSAALAKEAAFLALLSHAFAKSGIFLAVGALVLLVKSRNIASLQGSIHYSPLSVFALGLASISLIGLPPSLGFFSKWYYLQVSLDEGTWVFFVAILLGGALSAAYLFKLLLLTFLSPKQEILIEKPSSFYVLEWSAFLLSFLSVALGIFNLKITDGIF